jgi:hypothetical protein
MSRNLTFYCSSQYFPIATLCYITDRLVGALSTIKPLYNNKLVIDWQRRAWISEQLRRHHVHGKRMLSRYCSLASPGNFIIEVLNETKFHFLPSRHSIDTLLDRALFDMPYGNIIYLTTDMPTVLA